MSTKDTKQTKKKTVVLGVSVEVDPAVFDDFNLTILISKAEENFLLIPKVFEKILGEDMDRVMGALSNDQGRLPHDKAMTFFKTLADELNPKA